MRRLVLLAVLASACDQGATAAPPAAVGPLERAMPPALPPPPRITIESDAAFVAQAMEMLDELFAVFGQRRGNDCDQLAMSVEQFAAQNVTRIARLSDYARSHPTAHQPLTDAFMLRSNDIIQKYGAIFSACAGDARFMSAFERLDPQKLQRPR